MQQDDPKQQHFDNRKQRPQTPIKLSFVVRQAERSHLDAAIGGRRGRRVLTCVISARLLVVCCVVLCCVCVCVQTASSARRGEHHSLSGAGSVRPVSTDHREGPHGAVLQVRRNRQTHAHLRQGNGNQQRIRIHVSRRGERGRGAIEAQIIQ